MYALTGRARLNHQKRACNMIHLMQNFTVETMRAGQKRSPGIRQLYIQLLHSSQGYVHSKKKIASAVFAPETVLQQFYFIIGSQDRVTKKMFADRNNHVISSFPISSVIFEKKKYIQSLLRIFFKLIHLFFRLQNYVHENLKLICLYFK